MRCDPRGKRMNGTRNWCTLVDVHPEGQTEVRMRPHSLPARDSRFPIPPLARPAAAGRLTSPGAALRAVGPSRRGSCFSRPAAGSGTLAKWRVESLLRLEDSGRRCPSGGGHCGRWPGLGAGPRCALLGRPVARRAGRRRLSSRGGISALFWTLGPDEED